MKNLVIRPFENGDLEAWRTLLGRPEFSGHFDTFQGPAGLESALADEHLDREGIRLAFLGDEPVGFAFAYVLPQAGEGWAMMRVAVTMDHRRKGIGAALAREVASFVARQTRIPDVRTISGSSFEPCPGAFALADKLGFSPERSFWLMERPRIGAPDPCWPDAVTVTTFDGSAAHLSAWNDIYNISFARHWRFVPSTVEECAKMATAPGFRPDGLALVWRAGLCIGFCRCSIYKTRGEVEVLGTHPEARGIGLGRALLRWGVRWLESHPDLPVTLMVDGSNENALALYRSEGFETIRTRRVWNRALAGAL